MSPNVCYQLMIEKCFFFLDNSKAKLTRNKLFLSWCSIQRRWCDEFYPPHHHRPSLSSPAVLRSSLVQIWLCRFLLVWVVLPFPLRSAAVCGTLFWLRRSSFGCWVALDLILIMSDGFSTLVGWRWSLCVVGLLLPACCLFTWYPTGLFWLLFSVRFFCVVVSFRWRWWWLCVAMLLLFLLFCLLTGRWSWWWFDPDLGCCESSIWIF